MSEERMRLLIITGLSGSGKSSVLHALEDRGFYCVDNLPTQLLPRLVEHLEASGNPEERLAVGIDMRERSFLQQHPDVFQVLRAKGIEPEVIFLETTTEVLVRRFEETRRRHPLAEGRGLLEGIEWEREQMFGLRQMADKVIDTSSFNIHQLRNYIQVLYGPSGEKDKK